MAVVVHDAQLDYFGQRLATASGQTISVYALSGEAPNQQKTLQAELKDHTGPVWGVAWAHPKFDKLIASCSYDGKVTIWREGRVGQWLKIFTAPHDCSVNSVAWAPHEAGAVLAAGCGDGTVTILTRQGNTFQAQSFMAHLGGVNAVSWASDTKEARLATGGCDNYVRTWVNQQGQWVQPPQSGVKMCHRRWVRDVQWQPSVGAASHALASSSDDTTVAIWSKGPNNTWALAASLPFESVVCSLSWSLGGDVLAVAQVTGQSSLWKQGGNGQWGAVTQPQPEKEKS